MSRRILLLILACITSPFLCLAQEKPAFSAADIKSDLAYCYETIAKAHYNLYAYTSKRKFDKTYAALKQSITQDSVGLLETTRIFQKLTAIANTGHCEVDFPAGSYIAYAQQGGTVFPLELALEDGVAYVRKNFSSNAALKPGTQIISIDQIPVGKILARIHPYLSAERVYFKNTKLELYSFPRLYWSLLGAKPSFTVQLKDARGEMISHEITAIPVMEYETRRGGEILSSERAFKYLNDVGYLNPGPFGSALPDGEARFKRFIDSVFTDLQAQKTSTLLIDLRNNPGGHNAYSDYLIAYFADKPFRWHSAFQLKSSAVLKEQSRPQNTAEVTDDYTKAILSHADGEVYAYSFPLQQPAPAPKRFTGKVLVLINRQSYSMAAVSAALIQDYGFGKIVGEETGDVPTMYGSQFSFVLPRTKLVVKVPKGYFVRPNGSTKLAGVQPDYPVRDHLLDEEDEVLTYVLDKLLVPASAGK
ncbi:S41 family peptidase [Hymenobacter koreensis]|uniref:Tail specific protease domain-containing protein n=1 Tax=Hymenobacter koreensis TaxID=1084523 RepID=A0ABP8IT88_9BACT